MDMMIRERLFVVAVVVLALSWVSEGAELLSNGGFESLQGWECYDHHCSLSGTRHSGQHAIQSSGRHHTFEGPEQYIHVTPGQNYHVSAWVKLLSDPGGHGQQIQLEMDFTLRDSNHHVYIPAATHNHATLQDDWVHLIGSFTAPNKDIKTARFYVQGPEKSVNFLVDDASVTSTDDSQSQHGSHGNSSHSVIDQIRKSDIHVQVNAAAGISKSDVRIRVLQTKKAFPFGTAVDAYKYNANVAGGKYRDFIHTHFNWVVHENALKWTRIEHTRGELQFKDALDMIHGVKSHGIKVRGHNLVWSIERYVPHWVRQLSGHELRTAVSQHIQVTLQKTHGLLEHWDVNNENLHGTWYQDRLHDPDYDLELFNITHRADPHVKLFLNDYSVVSSSGGTNRYLQQAQRFKAANVGLYGMGAQCHFGHEHEPSPEHIKQRLDTLAKAGLPIWITELDVSAHDENRRADFYEAALRAFYGHPAVEGVMFWGFWDQSHWRGANAAIVHGNDLQPNAAGRRVLDLLENQWMTDDTRVLSQTGNQYTVRGFHGDYEVRVIYKGQELTHLKKTFTLGKSDHTVTVDVHT